MAYPTTFNQAKREYLYSKLGTDAKPTMRLTQLERMWYESQVGTGRYEGLSSLELRWLKKIIIDAGDTPSGDNFADLWKEALVAVGLTPKQSIDENRKLFYLTQK
jgi:hypothetical protein